MTLIERHRDGWTDGRTGNKNKGCAAMHDYRYGMYRRSMGVCQRESRIHVSVSVERQQKALFFNALPALFAIDFTGAEDESSLVPPLVVFLLGILSPWNPFSLESFLLGILLPGTLSSSATEARLNLLIRQFWPSKASGVNASTSELRFRY